MTDADCPSDGVQEQHGAGRLLGELVGRELTWSFERQVAIQGHATHLVTTAVSIIAAFVVVAGLVLDDEATVGLRASDWGRGLLVGAGIAIVVSAVLASVALVPGWYKRPSLEGMREYSKPEHFDQPERYSARQLVQNDLGALESVRKYNRDMAWYVMAGTWVQILGIALGVTALAVLSYR